MGMEMLILLIILLFVAGPLALFSGVDSRDHDTRDVRHWFPADPRS
jgi:hypothetical protein